MIEAHWTLGVLIGVPILIFVLLAGIIGIILLLKKVEDGDFFAIMVGVALVFVLVVAAISYFPYKADYHRWVPITGQVQEINKRLVNKGNGMADRFIFRINGQPYAVDDTRATLAKVGDTVSLSCIKEYEWASVPGYACRWNQ